MIEGERPIKLETHQKMVDVGRLADCMSMRCIPALEEAVKDFQSKYGTTVDTHTHMSALITFMNLTVSTYLLACGLDAVTYLSIPEAAVQDAEEVLRLEKQYGGDKS